MEGKRERKRLAESWLGKSIAGLIAGMWLASMATVDSNAYSAMPMYGGLACIAGLAALGLLCGYRTVRLSWLNWIALAAGCYYLGRCAVSYTQVEAWSETALILGCLIFYVAGTYAVRSNGHKVAAILALGLAINLVYFVLMRQTDVSMLWTGRPTHSLSGSLTRPLGLLAYKNWAALYLSASGAALLWYGIWAGKWRMGTLLGAALGCAGIAASFFCESRGMALSLALALVAGWLIWVMIRLNSGEKMGMGVVGGGIALGIALLVLFCDFIWGGTLLGEIADWDSHIRYQIWKSVSLAAQQAPPWGFGARATEWEIIPYFSDFALPNYAHNEYLQAWLDYGIIGATLLAFILISHLAAGIWFMSVEGETRGRRLIVGLAMLWLIIMMGGAAADYVWHQYGLAVMTAFACGAMASPPVRPLAAPRGAPPAYAVRGQGLLGRLILLAGCVGIIALCVPKIERLLPPWKAQWGYAALVENGATPDERCQYLLPILRSYPDSRVADEYMRIGRQTELPFQETEEILRLVLQANPKQLYTATMLANLLSQQRRFAEADALLRDSYPGDGPGYSSLNSWPAFYGLNLLYWGYHLMGEGQQVQALSLMSYALNMNAHEWLGIRHGWHESIKELLPPHYRHNHEAFLQARMIDVRTMRAVGVQPDDAWQKPYREGGKPALYQRWGNVPLDKPQQGKIISTRTSS